MLQNKLCLFALHTLFEACIACMRLDQLRQERFVGAPGEFKFFVQKHQHATCFLFNQVQHCLVVYVIRRLKRHAFAPVQLFFQLERVFVEVLLQLFVGKIDAQLLETVSLENLETKNVQNANYPAGVHGRRWAHGVVGTLHNPVELVAVNRLRQRVPCVGRLLKAYKTCG